MKIIVLTLAALAVTVPSVLTGPNPAVAATKHPSPKPKPKPVVLSKTAKLLSNSLNSMKALRSFQSQGTESGNAAFNAASAAQLTTTGSCTGKIPQPFTGSYQGGSLKTMATIGGTVKDVHGKTTVLDVHYIMITKGGSTRGWERAPQTHGTWQLERAGVGPGQPIEVLVGNSVTSFMCSPLLFPHEDIKSIVATFQLPGISHLSDLGSSTVNGVLAEHLQGVSNLGAGKSTSDFYIAKSDNYWVRYVLTVRVASAKARYHRLTVRTYNYSHFNAPVSLKAPKVGATSP